MLNVLEKWGVLSDVSSGFTVRNKLREIMGLEWHPFNERAALGFVLLSIPLSEPDRTIFSDRLNLEREVTIAIEDLAVIETLQEYTCRGQIYELLSGRSQLAMEAISSYDEVQLGKHIELFQSELSKLKVEISGDDLIGMGLEESPEIGRVIQALRNAIIVGNISTREEQIEFVKSLIVTD